MISKNYIEKLIKARQMLPKNAWEEVISKLSEISCADNNSIEHVLSDLSNTNAAWLLKESFEKKGNLSWKEVSAILTTINFINDSSIPELEILWSGPSQGLFPVRRFDQVLYDLIRTSETRILLVTFAAVKIDLLCKQLHEALKKGIAVSLILEAESESEGQLSFDAIKAFKPIISQGCKVYYWPLEQRERNQAGRPGKLHAKCAVVDSKAIIGSANLTDDAFNRNLELGVLINDPSVANQLYRHFKALIENKILKRITG